MRALPLHAGARGLLDDTAVLGTTVLTKDLLVEGVHFLSTDPAADVAWKLVATNLSDLAAKGAVPTGVLLGYPLSETDWDRAFLVGLTAVLREFQVPLLGGDTVRLPAGAPRTLSLTAVGSAERVPTRGGAKAGDALWVTGTIGDAGAGLAIALGEPGPPFLLDRYRRPQPRLAEGRVLAPLVHAMMDVSDGLLIDAGRMADASRLSITIDLERVPISPMLLEHRDDGREARLAAATAGDDYELLFALEADVQPPIAAQRIGSFSEGSGLNAVWGKDTLRLPARLGYEHGVE